MAEQFGNQTKTYSEKLVRSALNNFKAFAYEQLTVADSIVNLTVPDEAKYAVIVLESSITTVAVRYLEFGGSNTVVTAGSGIPISTGSAFDITDYQNLIGFQAIQEAAGTHLLNVQYYK